MAGHKHPYSVKVTWQGNRGSGTTGYREYDRDYLVSAKGKVPIEGSADGAFRGDRAKWNPEDLLVASLSACHKLWYLHFCAVSGVVVTAYEDDAEGTMVMDETGSGRFTEVVLRPRVTITDRSDDEAARELHDDAHEKCFIANSVNFPVRCEPVILRESQSALASEAQGSA